MKKFKKIFYAFYLAFLIAQIAILIYVTYFPDQIFSFYLRNINKIMGYLQIYLLLGLFILVIEWITENLHINMLNNRIKELEHDNNALKAKYYDDEEKRKNIDSSLRSFGESIDKNKNIDKPGFTE